VRVDLSEDMMDNTEIKSYQNLVFLNEREYGMKGKRGS
jgi:hypothetical protein